jgi:hypothetical protein
MSVRVRIQAGGNPRIIAHNVARVASNTVRAISESTELFMRIEKAFGPPVKAEVKRLTKGEAVRRIIRAVPAAIAG